MHLTAAEWARIEALFPQLAELPAAERLRFLERECAGEPRVRCELEAMLAVAGTEDPLLDRQVALSSNESSPAVEELAAGTRMGSWKIKTLIGHGGMGEVYLADRADGAYAMSAAIKLLKKELFSYANAQRFLRERRVLARLSHPNIARVLDAGTTDDGRPYLVMEYVHGTRVTDYARARNLPPDAAVRLMLAVADAVAEAHRRGVVHRDLKPANVMVDGEQQVKLLDFGIARLTDEDDAATPGVVAMTPAYAAPEQVRGETPSPAADVYALGVMLFQLLTQRLPHTREGMPLQVVLAGLDAEAPEAPSRVVLASQGLFPEGELRRRADAIADGLDPIVLRALRANPAKRYANAGEFAEELRRWLDRRPAAPRRDSALERARGWLDRLLEPPPAAPAAGDYKYWAFISYSHQDENWARWLHTTLETWRVPSRLVGRALGDETIPRRLFPVFRDRDELPSSHELGAVINQALRQSRNLIVVCSPRAATSRWVNEEVKAFRALGRGHRVFCLIVDGDPNASARPEIAFSECFAPALREAGMEPIAADARPRKDGKAGARLKLLAGILGVGLDELKQREKQRQLRQRVLTAAAAIAIAGVLGGTVQWFLGERAAREREIWIEKLVESGRLELLEGRQARAAVYLNEARKLGADSVPLRFMLGQAMLAVDAQDGVRVRHGGATVRRALFSPDGKQFVLIVPDGDKAVARIYDTASGAERIALKDVPAYPRITQFIGDGSRLLVSGYAQQDRNSEAGPSVAVWSLDKPEPLFAIEGFCGRAGTPVNTEGTLAVGTEAGLELVNSTSGERQRLLEAGRLFTALSYSNDGRWLASADQAGKIELRAAPGYTATRRLQGSEGAPVAALAFTPDGSRVLALSYTGDVRIWDVASGAQKVAFGADLASVSGLTFSADSRRLLTIGSEGYKVWSAGRGVLLFDIRNPLYRDASAALSPDGDYLYVADDTASIAEIWGVRSGTRLQTLDLHTNSVSAIALDTSGQRLLLGSKDGTAEIWRARINPALPLNLGGPSHLGGLAPTGVLWGPRDQSVVVTGGVPGEVALVAVMDARSGATQAKLEGHRNVVVEAALSPDRRRLLSADADGIARLWDLESRTELAVLELGVAAHQVGFSPDDSRAVLLGLGKDLSGGGAATLLDSRTGKVIATLGNQVQHQGFAFSPDGTQLAFSDQLGQVKIVNPGDGSLRRAFAALSKAAGMPRFDPSGNSLITTGEDHAVRIWPVTGGAPIAELDDPALGWTWQAVMAPDGQQVAIATTAGPIWLWNIADGSTRTLKGHTSEPRSLQFLHGGALLLSSSHDGTIRAWDPRTATQLAVLAALGGEVNDLGFSKDEARLAVSSAVTRLAGIWSLGLEGRSAGELELRLRCTPWALREDGLVQTTTASPGCVR